MSDRTKIQVGSRKSELALIQTKHVISLLKKLNPDKEFEIVTMSTLGDTILDIPLPKIGEKSLFTKELETALETGRVDFLVHSLKDLPTTLPSGMAIGAVLTREDPRDALVLQKDLKGHSLSTLPKGSVIGTSSLRRTAQLAKQYSHLKVENIRGNLNTRLKKLDDLGKYQAIILASAGMIRIGWKDRISKLLNAEEFLYAVGQGALAVECRSDDENTIKLLEPLYDLHTALSVIAERSFLHTLGGGCSAPVAVNSDVTLLKGKEVKVSLRGAVWSLDGQEEVIDSASTTLNIINGIRCNQCPFTNGNTDVQDIECCTSPPVSPVNEPATKKQKLDEAKKYFGLTLSDGNQQITNAMLTEELLAKDPHDLCPIEIPIGLDFMGQCPFLDGDLQTIHSKISLTNSRKEIQEKARECPFLKREAVILNSVSDNKESNEKQLDDDDHFVGLVSHKYINKQNMDKARQLGKDLANKLIEQGALEIMTKAQSIIHGSVQNIVSKN